MSSEVNSNPVTVALFGDDRHAEAAVQFQYLITPNSSQEIREWLDAIAKDDKKDGNK